MTNRRSGFHSRTVEKETEHTLSLVAPHLGPGGGAGRGVRRGVRGLADRRALRVRGAGGRRGGLPPRSPGAVLCVRRAAPSLRRWELRRRAAVVRAPPHARRVQARLARGGPAGVAPARCWCWRTRRAAPSTSLFSWWHGERFRQRVGSREAFGFLSGAEWTRLFRPHGVGTRSTSRCRAGAGRSGSRLPARSSC